MEWVFLIPLVVRLNFVLPLRSQQMQPIACSGLYSSQRFTLATAASFNDALAGTKTRLRRLGFFFINSSRGLFPLAWLQE